MAKKILFVGAGTIGSYIGSFLSRAGHDVTLVDPWAEQVETIRKKGISVTGPHDPFEARPKACHLNESQRMPRDFDLAFVAMKVYDTAWAAQLALRHLKPEGFIVASENCWPDPIVAGVAGASRSLGLVMSKIGVAVWKPGQVERGAEKGQGTGHDVFRVGEHDGKVTPRATEVAEMLKVVDGSQVTENLWGERWAKLCANATGNPVQAMSGLGSAHLARGDLDPPWRRVRAGWVGARASCAEIRRHHGRAVGRCRPPRGLRRPGPDAHADLGRRTQLALFDGAGRDQGPPDRDRLHERLRGGAGPRARRAHAGFRCDGRHRPRGRRRYAQAGGAEHRPRPEARGGLARA